MSMIWLTKGPNILSILSENVFLVCLMIGDIYNQLFNLCVVIAKCLSKKFRVRQGGGGGSDGCHAGVQGSLPGSDFQDLSRHPSDICLIPPSTRLSLYVHKYILRLQRWDIFV